MRWILIPRFAVFAAVILLAGGCAMREMHLVPMPQEVTLHKGSVTVEKDWKVAVPDADANDAYAARLLAEEAKACFGWSPAVVTGGPGPSIISIEAYAPRGTEPELFKTQGYLLRVESDRIRIQAPTATGRFYGVQTLRQMMRGSRGGVLPRADILDYPALEWRGISDDISRGQVSLPEDFEYIIRQLAYYKKNLYQPYIEDMFAFDTDPEIGRARGHVTKAEMARLVEEARKNHVVLCPVFECLGHQDRLLGLPQNRKYAELQDPEKTPWSFSPVLPESFEFVTRLVDEMAGATPSPFFHIGGDESYDIGEGTSKQRVQEIGVGRVHAEFFSKLIHYIQKTHNRRVMLYGDMLLRHPEALEHMPKDALIVDWHYSPVTEYPSIRQLKDAGFTHILASPGLWSWAAFYPNYHKGFRNVATFADNAKRERLLGCITSSWGDNGAENLRRNNITGFAFSAAAEWEPISPDPDAFLRRYVVTRYGADSAALARAERTLGFIEPFKDTYPANMFHRRLQLRTRGRNHLATMIQLQADMRQALDAVKQARTEVRFDREQLDNIEQAAWRFLFLAERDIALDKIAAQLKSKPFAKLTPAERKDIVDTLARLHNELGEITAQFKTLWLLYNKEPKLDFNIERLDRQRGELKTLLDAARAGTLAIPDEPDSVWFWYPDADPKVITAEGTRYFLRPFTLEKTPEFAEVKVWGDDRARVFINGRRAATAAYGDPPALREVTDWLKPGPNTIAIEGYNAIGAAGILFRLMLRYPDKSIEMITGDEHWRVAVEAPAGWNTATPDGPDWKPVKLLGKGLIEPWDFIDW